MRALLSRPIPLLLLLLPALLAGAAAAQQPATPQPPPAAAQHRTGASGLPLPRFASLASSEVNVRTGPGKDYPIHWVYTRPGLPVRIVDEYDVWRLVEDPDGDKGWTHSSLLSLRRTVVVKGGTQAMRRSADANSAVILRADRTPTSARRMTAELASALRRMAWVPPLTTTVRRSERRLEWVQPLSPSGSSTRRQTSYSSTMRTGRPGRV